jgi:hypothetical protein
MPEGQFMLQRFRVEDLMVLMDDDFPSQAFPLNRPSPISAVEPFVFIRLPLTVNPDEKPLSR